MRSSNIGALKHLKTQVGCQPRFLWSASGFTCLILALDVLEFSASPKEIGYSQADLVARQRCSSAAEFLQALSRRSSRESPQGQLGIEFAVRNIDEYDEDWMKSDKVIV